MSIQRQYMQSNHKKESPEKPPSGKGIPLLSLALCIIFESTLSNVASESGNFLAHQVHQIGKKTEYFKLFYIPYFFHFLDTLP